MSLKVWYLLNLVGGIELKREKKRRRKVYKESTYYFLVRKLVEIARWLGYNYFFTISPSSEENLERILNRIKEWFRRRGIPTPAGIKGIAHYHLLVYLPDGNHIERFRSYLQRQQRKRGYSKWVFKLQEIKFWKFGSYFVKHVEELKRSGRRLKIDELIVAPKIIKKVLFDSTLRGLFKELLAYFRIIPSEKASREYNRNLSRWVIVRSLIKKILLWKRSFKRIKNLQKRYNEKIVPERVVPKKWCYRGIGCPVLSLFGRRRN